MNPLDRSEVSFIFPAIRGQMGSTEYFQVTARAQELAGVAMPANELPDWREWTLGEKIQRDINVNRVRSELVPYLVRSQDRFFGSLIVLAYKPDTFEFEPVSSAGVKAPAAYRDVLDRMGFLTVNGGNLVALDGQHRLVALREIVTGRIDTTGEFAEAIADDELSVVFIRFESLEKTRRIFNKVNRYAKPTSTTDNIITSEDDGYAIVARWLIENDPPLGLPGPIPPLARFDQGGNRLVEVRKANLSQGDRMITTLTHVCQSVEVILDAHGLHNFDEKHRVNRPPNDELSQAYQWSAEWWAAILDGMPAFAHALEHPEQIPELRKAGAKWSLLFRPVAQVALFRGLALARVRGYSLSEAIERAAGIDWRSKANQWQDVIIRSNGQPITSLDARRLAGRVIEYQIASKMMSAAEIDRLRNDFAAARAGVPGGPLSRLPEPLP